MLLNCTVRTVDDAPIVGVRAHALYMEEPDRVYCGSSDSVGKIWFWSYPDSSNHRKYSIDCPQGSKWRVFFEVPDHPFPSISVDLHVPHGDLTDANTNVTLTIAPETVALSNGSFGEIGQRNGVNMEGPYLLSRRSSSSLGDISDISSFTLDSDYYGGDVPLLMSDARSMLSPPHSPQPPLGVPDGGDVVAEAWFGTEMGVKGQSRSSHKRKYDGDDSGDTTASKHARISKE